MGSCAGVEGIVSAYYNSLNTVRLYGPTNFAPVINHVANFAAAHQGEATNYFVLLILTDGIITDFDDTKRALVGASSLPMSVIIVGIGTRTLPPWTSSTGISTACSIRAGWPRGTSCSLSRCGSLCRERAAGTRSCLPRPFLPRSQDKSPAG